MARPRKIVDMQSSHLTKEQKQRKKQEEQTVVVGNEDLEKPPTWLKRTEKNRNCWKSRLRESCLLLQCLCKLCGDYKAIKGSAVLCRT